MDNSNATCCPTEELCIIAVGAALTRIAVIAGMKRLIPSPHPSDLDMRQTWVSTGNSQRRRQNMSTQAAVFLPTPLKRVSSAFIASSSSSLRGTMHTCSWCAVVKIHMLQSASKLPVDAAGLRHVLLIELRLLCYTSEPIACMDQADALQRNGANIHSRCSIQDRQTQCPPEVLQDALAALLQQRVQDDLRSCSTAAQYCNMQTSSSKVLLHRTLLKTGGIPRF